VVVKLPLRGYHHCMADIPLNDSEIETQLAGTRNPVPGVASVWLHRGLMFSAQLENVPAYWGFLAAGFCLLPVLLSWTLRFNLTAGVAAGLLFLALGGVDGLALVLLPRRGRSFGPVMPPLLALLILRAAATSSVALLPLPETWLAALAIGGNAIMTGCVIDGLWIEPFRVSVTRITVQSPKLNGLPPLRLLHLSDFHIERLTRREARVLELIDTLRPDVIVYTGDLLNFSNIDDPVARDECARLLTRLHAPQGVFGIPGTPLVDTPSVQADLYPRAANIRWLRNETIALSDYPVLHILGVTCTHDSLLDAPKLERLCEALSDHSFKLLLYHAPDLMPEASGARIDLYLCGHTHGGQIRLPFYGAVFTSSLYGKRYEMGCYREGATTLYVSRGLGLEGKGAPRMRLLCPPEMVLVELRGEQS
jgi:hypothetical protein